MKLPAFSHVENILFVMIAIDVKTLPQIHLITLK